MGTGRLKAGGESRAREIALGGDERARILAFSYKGVAGAKFAGGKTRANAHDTPILAFPHKGLTGG